MTIDELNARIIEIDTAIQNANNNVIMLHGHKAEAVFHLEAAKKAAEALEIPAEPPVE